MAKTARIIYRHGDSGSEVPAEFGFRFKGTLAHIEHIHLQVEVEKFDPEYLEFLVDGVPVARYDLSLITTGKLSPGDSIYLT